MLSEFCKKLYFKITKKTKPFDTKSAVYSLMGNYNDYNQKSCL